MLKIARNLELPLDFVTERIAFLARTGAGKSGGMRVLAEEMLAAGQFIVFLDPKGDAWGIRSDYSVLVMGGEHGDVPLQSTAGKFVADFLVKERISCVLDVSEFSEADMVRFVADFGEQFYRRNRDAMHLFIDEADEFAPQSGYNASQLKCMGAIQRIQRRGRGRGIGVTVATQRSAVLNKSVLTQAGTMIAMQTTAPHDLKAVDAWLEYAATKEARKEIMSALSTLKPREAFVYSPQYLGSEPKRITFRAFHSFDSMRTPKHGEKRQQPKRLADVDLSAVQKEMAATIEEAKANDPAELKKQIRELQKKVDAKTPVADEKATERAALAAATAERKKWEPIVSAAESTIKKQRGQLDQIAALAQKNGEVIKFERPQIAKSADITVHKRHPVLTKPVARSRTETSSSGDIPKGEVAILSAAIQYPEGLDRSQLTVLTGYKRSTRDAYIARLQEKGYVATGSGRVVATSEGQAALPDAEPLPTGEALQDFWMQRLPSGECIILNVLINAHPESVTRDSLTEATGFKRSTRDAYIARMKAKQLVVDDGGGIRATDNLF